jgi:hypothetical protein
MARAAADQDYSLIVQLGEIPWYFGSQSLTKSLHLELWETSTRSGGKVLCSMLVMYHKYRM